MLEAINTVIGLAALGGLFLTHRSLKNNLRALSNEVQKPANDNLAKVWKANK